MKVIKVGLKNTPYKIYIDYKLTKSIPKYIKHLKLGNFGLIITSNKVYSLYKKQITNIFKAKNYRVLRVPDGEIAKSKECFLKVIAEVTKADSLDKKLFIICLGGGTVGDLGGFLASIYKRGIPYIHIPTTLLSQIDSSIGGKTGIDLKIAKNILGAFYQPKAVFIDPGFLTTLPVPELKQGIAEAIKYGVIKNRDLFDFLKKNYAKALKLERTSIMHIICTCVKIKAKIVTDDEKETRGLRTILNFGHTFAHALEASLKYKKISHGEAVSLGMAYAGMLSLYLKKCSLRDYLRLIELLKLFSLPVRVEFDPQALYKSLAYDKKFTKGKIRMVLLERIGKVGVLDGLSPQIVRKTLRLFAGDKLTKKGKYGIVPSTI